MFRVFFSYSHKDRELRDELETHLTILKRQGVIDTWHDRDITAGEDWAQRIDAELEAAHIILLLVSADFLASDYCYDREMNRAMARHEAGEAVVIPVILRACDWKDAPFAQALCVPTDGKPIRQYSDRDAAFQEITGEIRRAIQRLSDAHHRPVNDSHAEEEPEHWIIKTLDHKDQVDTLRHCLKSGKPGVAVVEGCLDDCPDYMADHVFLLPWPRLDLAPDHTAHSLNIACATAHPESFWDAIHDQRVPAPQQARDGNQQVAVRNWLRGRDRHLFYLSLSMGDEGRYLPRLVNAARGFLAELPTSGTRETHENLIILIICSLDRQHVPWHWRLRRWLWERRFPATAVCWLTALRHLHSTDIQKWRDGFSEEACQRLKRDWLRDELHELFRDTPHQRYKPISKHLKRLLGREYHRLIARAVR